MKTQPQILIAIISLLPFIAFARLGDTPESLAQRMGVSGTETTSGTKPALANTRTFVFQKDSINLVVTFWNGKSCEESYKKTDGGEFADAEIQTILKQNNFGSDWQLDSRLAAVGRKHWTWGGTLDVFGNVTSPVLEAVYFGGLFGMYSTKFRQASDAADSAASQKKIQGF